MATEIDLFILYANAAIWLFTLWVYIKKRGMLTVGFSLLLLYTLIAVSSISLYQNELSVFYFEKRIDFLPFLYLYVMIMMAIYPILRIDEQNIKYFRYIDYKYIDVICGLISILSIVMIVKIIPDLRQGLIMMLVDDSTVDLYSQSTQKFLDEKPMSGNVNILGVLFTLAKGFSPFFFFAYLLKPNKNWMILLGLFMALFIQPLEGISKASRVLIVTPLLVDFFFFLFIRHFLPKNIVSRIYKWGGVSLSILITFFFLISWARSNGELDRMLYGYQRYFSESFLVFNNYCMDAGGTRDGQITFPIICKVLGNEVYSSNELRLHYSHLKIDNSRFSTFVGDFVLDIGVWWAFWLFVLISFWAARSLIIRNRCMRFDQLFFLYFMLKFTLGFFQYIYTGVGGNLLFLVSLFAFFCFKYMPFLYRKKIYIIKS